MKGGDNGDGIGVLLYNAVGADRVVMQHEVAVIILPYWYQWHFIDNSRCSICPS